VRRRPANHFLRFFADCQHLASLVINRHHRRLINNNPPASDVNQRIGCSQINAYVFFEIIEKHLLTMTMIMTMTLNLNCHRHNHRHCFKNFSSSFSPINLVFFSFLFFSSILPPVFSLITARYGIPIKSASANFSPAETS